MNLILFGGFLYSGHYRGMSVGWVISVIPQSCGMTENRGRHIIESLADTGLRGFLCF